jgi:hypothetical protein
MPAPATLDSETGDDPAPESEITPDPAAAEAPNRPNGGAKGKPGKERKEKERENREKGKGAEKRESSRAPQ